MCSLINSNLWIRTKAVSIHWHSGIPECQNAIMGWYTCQYFSSEENGYWATNRNWSTLFNFAWLQSAWWKEANIGSSLKSASCFSHALLNFYIFARLLGPYFLERTTLLLHKFKAVCGSTDDQVFSACHRLLTPESLCLPATNNSLANTSRKWLAIRLLINTR